MAWEISDDEARSSFEVVDVSFLPAIDHPDIRLVPSVDRPCGCHHCHADWQSIAAAAVLIFEEGIDPLDRPAISSRAEVLGLDERHRRWLLDLFSPTQGIIVLRDNEEFTNGMHRTHALRMYGVERCVIYTGKGELP